MDWFERLKGKRLGKTERALLLEMSYRPQTRYHRREGLDYYARQVAPPRRTDWLASFVYNPDTYSNPARKDQVATYRALRSLQKAGLAKGAVAVGRRSGIPYKRIRWDLTATGLAVVQAYEEELEQGRRIRWDRKSIATYLGSEVERLRNAIREKESAINTGKDIIERRPELASFLVRQLGKRMDELSELEDQLSEMVEETGYQETTSDADDSEDNRNST